MTEEALYRERVCGNRIKCEEFDPDLAGEAADIPDEYVSMGKEHVWWKGENCSSTPNRTGTDAASSIDPNDPDAAAAAVDIPSAEPLYQNNATWRNTGWGQTKDQPNMGISHAPAARNRAWQRYCSRAYRAQSFDTILTHVPAYRNCILESSAEVYEFIQHQAPASVSTLSRIQKK